MENTHLDILKNCLLSHELKNVNHDASDESFQKQVGYVAAFANSKKLKSRFNGKCFKCEKRLRII